VNCRHTLYDHNGPTCDRTDEHDETAAGGHTYRSSAGSEVNDRHDVEHGHG